MEWSRNEDNWNVPILSWCPNVERVAMEQAIALACHPVIANHVALMPDVHPGYGMPIGGVIACDNAVIPNAVGVDIGCGMRAVATDVPVDMITPGQIAAIITDIKRAIPVGYHHHKDDQRWSGFDDAPGVMVIQAELASARKQLGTLGSGNHFIEIQAGDDGYIWVMIHSGSRNFGLKIADHFNKRAMNLCNQWHSELPSDDLAFLPTASDSGKTYIVAMQYAMRFAEASRKAMMGAVLRIIAHRVDGKAVSTLDVHHNFAAIEHHFGKDLWIHRKGAILIRKDDLGIIPGSQGTPSYIVRGLGNADSYHSCSHGAGRTMGRKDFSRTHTLEDCEKEMDGILFDGYGLDRDGGIDLSEAPSAYKNIDKVIAEEADIVEVVVKLLPLGSVKDIRRPIL